MSARPPPASAWTIVRDGGAETPVFETTGDRGALAGYARPMLGRGLRLGGVVRIPRRRRLAVRRLPRHADGRGPRRQADPLPPSLHRQPAARQEARPHAAGRGDRHLDSPTTPGAAPTTIRASPGPNRDQFAHGRQHAAAAGAAASSCCRRMRRACRSRSSLPPTTAPRYPHMEWAFATGHSKKYASSGWASYDSHFFRWAERARLCGRSRQPARAAFRARNPRRL